VLPEQALPVLQQLERVGGSAAASMNGAASSASDSACTSRCLRSRSRMPPSTVADAPPVATAACRFASSLVESKYLLTGMTACGACGVSSVPGKGQAPAREGIEGRVVRGFCFFFSGGRVARCCLRT
jgi:hypothetical protein